MAKCAKVSEAKKRRRQAYKAENRYAKNKLRRLRKYVAKYPKDLQAAEALKRLEKKVEYTRNHPTTGRGINNNDRIMKPVEARVSRQTLNKITYGKNWDEGSIQAEWKKALAELLQHITDKKIRTKVTRKNRS